MRRVGRLAALAVVVVSGLLVASPSTAQAQVIVGAPVAPTIGYVPVRRGLFGRRTAFVPVVAPTVAPVAVARPVVSSPVVVARPVIAQPTVSQMRI